VRGSLAERVAELAKQRLSAPEVLNLLIQIGARRSVPGLVARLVSKAVLSGFRSLSKSEVESLVDGMEEVLRPAGTDLSLDRVSVKRLAKRIKLVVLGATATGRQRELRKLVDDVLGLVEKRATLRVKGRGKRTFTVRVDVPRTADPARIKGYLEINVNGSGTRGEFNIPVQAKLRPLTGVTLEPGSIDIQRTSPWPEDEQNVDLYGPGVAALLAGANGGSVRVRLRGRGGQIATVVLKLTAVGADHATGQVSIADNPGPGKYVGALPLTRLQTDPHFDVEVRSRLTRWVAFILIFASAFVAGAGRELSALGRRRWVLRVTLAQAWERYRQVCESIGGPTSYSLSDIDETTIREALDSIASARTNVDLDEDRDRVLELIARMQRWLRIEPVARRLAMVMERRPDGAIREFEWTSSWTLRYARTLRHALHREPKDVAAADDVVERAIWMTDWYHRFSRVWTGVSDPNTSDADIDALIALDKALADTPVFELTQAQRDELDARLDLLDDRLGARIRRHDPLPDVSRGVQEPVPRVNWNPPAYHFMGWATLSGPAFEQVAHRAQATARPLDRLAGTRPWRDRGRRGAEIWTTLRRYGPSEWLWTFVIAAAASVVYLNTIYDDTWGSLSDILTALVAGFGTSVAIQWAAMPIFQSVRLRATRDAGN
jgi:hypothetical protein